MDENKFQMSVKRYKNTLERLTSAQPRTLYLPNPPKIKISSVQIFPPCSPLVRLINHPPNDKLKQLVTTLGIDKEEPPTDKLEQLVTILGIDKEEPDKLVEFLQILPSILTNIHAPRTAPKSRCRFRIPTSLGTVDVYLYKNSDLTVIWNTIKFDFPSPKTG